MKFIDLFCGIGGFRVALEELGHQCVFSSDSDKDARYTYQKNYSEMPSGDITRISSEEIPKHQVLCGGFPCQPFSISGNQGGFDDARGTLLHEILRVARHRRPKILFLENVKNYLRHDGGKTLETTVRLLEMANYEVYFQLLNASRYGVAQKRERVYFVCFRKDLNITTFRFPSPLDKQVSLLENLLPQDDPRLEDLIVRRSDLRLRSPISTEGANKPIRVGTVGKGGQGERVYGVQGHAVTLSAFGGGVGARTGLYLQEDLVRRLHPEECRRLMGFPEGFVLHPRRNVCFKQFGNSVVVPVVKQIFQEIEKALPVEKLEAA